MPVTLNTTGITFSNGTSQSSAYTTGFGDIGSYAILWYAANADTPTGNAYGYLASGATIAGSSLRRSSTTTVKDSAQRTVTAFTWDNANTVNNVFNRSPFVAFNTGTTTTMSGTWRVMGGNLWVYRSSDSCGAIVNNWYPLLWVRIS